MNLKAGIKAGWRALWASGDNPEGWVEGGMNPAFDPAVFTEEKYLAISAYFACIRNISEDVGKLPLILYERIDRGKKRATEHKLYSRIRYRPAKPVTSTSLREALTRNALAWGNGYGRIYKNKGGDAALIYPLSSAYVKPQGDGKGGIQYEYQKPGKDKTIIPFENMIHIHGVGSDGMTGMSVASYGQQSMTMASAVGKFGTNLYTQNGRPAGILKTAAKLSPQAKKANVAAWKKMTAGDNMGGTAMLDNGLEYKQITVNPSDAQFLETAQFTVEDVARWFRMPLHKIQHLVRAQGWSTLDAQNTDYLTDTLLPWLNRIEDEFTYKLLGGHDKYFCEHLVNAMLRGDARTRAEYYVKMFSIGGLTINEIRELENMNPIPGEAGDKHFVPLNMTPAEFVNSVSGNKGADNSENKNLYNTIWSILNKDKGQ